MIAKPHTVVLVDRIPNCNFCDNPGPYDFKTLMGPWAHGCETHYKLYRAYPELGVGKGQLWVVEA